MKIKQIDKFMTQTNMFLKTYGVERKLIFFISTLTGRYQFQSLHGQNKKEMGILFSWLYLPKILRSTTPQCISLENYRANNLANTAYNVFHFNLETSGFYPGLGNDTILPPPESCSIGKCLPGQWYLL